MAQTYTKEEREDCFFYAREIVGDGCGHCFECYQGKCPVVVAKMTPAEKEFWCIKE